MKPEEPEWAFPFEWMQVGQSFFVPTLEPEPMIDTIVSRARAAGVRVRCFSSAKDGFLGVRAWRIR